jgi:hypothetical protein
MTYCNKKNVTFPRIKNKELKINFSGGNISSDGGLIPVHLLDKKLGIISDIFNAVKSFDIRNKSKMLRQRIYGIISGNEGLNDQDDLRLLLKISF